LKRKDFFLFFFLPFVGLILIFFLASYLNSSRIQKQVKGVIEEQLRASAGILAVGISHLLEEGRPPDTVLGPYSGGSGIYYIALLDAEKNILSWSSQFEGYLPLSLKDKDLPESWTIDSPAGKILNLFVPFSAAESQSYFLYLGYSLEDSLGVIAARFRKSLALILGILALAGLVFSRGVFLIQARYLAKTREADAERLQKEHYREISAFTAGIAHEIKNPLNSLALLFELMQKKGAAAVAEDVALGKNEVQKISRTIDQFSDFLKPLRLTKEPLTVEDLIAGASSSLAAEFPEKKAAVEYSPGAPLRLAADRQLIVQALFNILKNAVQAESRNPVRIDAEKTKKGIKIRIQDSGPGIPPAVIEHIFDPFFTTKTGMGVGLYLAKKIIERHEGKVTVESRPGQGALFTIQLPGG